jgi:cytochrome c biogenesis protein CcdA/thiol-disulfide isomerase/thioredoxin
MTLLFISLIAGLLTVLAPCVLPLLPVIIGGSITGEPNPRRALVTIFSLLASVFAFTFILKVSTAFISVPPAFWAAVSGILLIGFGIVTLFPSLYDRLGFVNMLNVRGNRAMNEGFKKKSFTGDVLIGAALGPVFASCSPTYFLILASVLPTSLAKGILYLLVYLLGMGIALFAIALLGQRLVGRLDGIADPSGWFKRTLGAVFIALGLLVMFGLDKKAEAYILAHAGVFDVTRIEQHLLLQREADRKGAIRGGETDSTASGNSKSGTASDTDSAATSTDTSASKKVGTPLLTLAEKAARYGRAPELVSPDAYLNTGGQPITIQQYRGKNVVLIDFWTYSCINCQRTLPYLTTWYGKYKDQGLVIIGVHTPEFAFEHEQTNVQKALAQFGITYPVVLDNEYKTWNAFGNNVWPRKYLIDIDGYVVYDHAGEGNYDEMERQIQKALRERAERFGMKTAIATSTAAIPEANLSGIGSPETYFGAYRNEYLANGTQSKQGTQTLTIPAQTQPNALYLGGTWNFMSEYAQASDGDTVSYTYTAKNVYVVASALDGGSIEVMQDGAPLAQAAGKDVHDGSVSITGSRLYHLVANPQSGTHTLTIKVHGKVQFYTFTFG